jgi:hypothetical protein
MSVVVWCFHSSGTRSLMYLCSPSRCLWLQESRAPSKPFISKDVSVSFQRMCLRPTGIANPGLRVARRENARSFSGRRSTRRKQSTQCSF